MGLAVAATEGAWLGRVPFRADEVLSGVVISVCDVATGVTGSPPTALP